MDFSICIWPWVCKVCVADEKYALQIPLWAISLLEEKDVYLMRQHCPIHPLNVKNVHSDEHLLHSSSVLQEFYLLGYEAW